MKFTLLLRLRIAAGKMAAFLHRCPFLKSAPKAALRRTGTALPWKTHRCPIIARQISVNSVAPSGDGRVGISPSKPKAEQRRLFTQTSPQVDVSVPKGCPFVASRIGMVHASPEVQEDIQKGKVRPNGDGNRAKRVRVTENVSLLTGLSGPALKGSKDETLPGSAQASSITHLLKDNMGEWNTERRSGVPAAGLHHLPSVQLVPLITTPSSAGRSRRRSRTTRTESSKP